MVATSGRWRRGLRNGMAKRTRTSPTYPERAPTWKSKEPAADVSKRTGSTLTFADNDGVAFKRPRALKFIGSPEPLGCRRHHRRDLPDRSLRGKSARRDLRTWNR